MQPYFSHDIFTREDLNIKRLINTHKMEGYGVFWAIVEFLHNNDNKINLNEIDVVAQDLKVDIKLVESVIKDFKLFSIKRNIVSSKRVAKNFQIQKEKSELAKKSAMSRWKKNSDNANALQTHCERNAIKEKKEKEIKEKEKKEEESKENKIQQNEKTEPQKESFLGQYNNVFLTSFQYGSLAEKYGKSLTETIINELSYNISIGKEQCFDEKFSDAHFARLERYALQKMPKVEKNSLKTEPNTYMAQLPAVEQKTQRRECEALKHIREIKEGGGVPPPKEFLEIGKRLKNEL